MEKGKSNSKVVDCYSARERAFMLLSQKFRGVLLNPLLSFLVSVGIIADHITLLSFIFGILFAVFFFFTPTLAIICLAVHCLLDGIDGPLARFRGEASKAGTFTDSMSDQAIVASTTITLCLAHIVKIVPGTIYFFLYTLVVAFSMIRNALGIPYSWLVRPRFIVYLWIPVELYVFPGTLNHLLWLFNVLLLLKVLTGFWKIRRGLG